MPLLRPLSVDLEELAGVLEGDPVTGGGRIDLRTGDLWSQPALEHAEETGDIDDDEERWLWVECEGSREGSRDMGVFIAAVDVAHAGSHRPVRVHDAPRVPAGRCQP